MTEYGRGPGSTPWHPEDPLYGDDGWAGHEGHAAQSPHGGQHHPEQPQQHYGDWGGGRQGTHDQGHQGYQQYADQQYQQPGQYPDGQSYDAQAQYEQQYPGRQGEYEQRYPGQGQQDYGNGGWDGGGQAHVPYAPDPADPYGAQPGAYGGEQPDFYQTPDAYPPPEPPNRRHAEPEPKTDWDPDPQEGEHAVFADGDDEEDADEPDGRRGRGDRRGRGGKTVKGKKRRNGCACLVVVLVFGGGIGTVGYFGYQFYQNRFGAAPDYVGEGDGEQVTVTIPKGAGGYTIGRVLKQAGVVKSVDAFVAAQEQNPDGKSIQAGTYTLNKHMSAAAAVQLMLSPKSKNNLIIAEGWRNTKIYAAIDQRLQLKPGTTRDVAKKEWSTFGLPDWANSSKEIKDPLEGFLYPSAYPVAKGMKPEDVLKQMVDMAKEKYAEFGLQAKAKGLDLQTPLQLLTVASLVQAEGKTHDDYRKMAEVIYNRLKPTNTETNQLLQFDSTFNYLKGQSKIRISASEINSNQDPYNTYTHKGLPPGPIDNPGDSALEAALNPTSDGWIYFVATDGMEKTEFAKTHAEFLKLRDEFNDSAGR
ncbi:endolytic transglycosylase MltG [Streptomyces sp. Ru72]|uniref:endolytic transglycosylase MltG n=1 Tax=Streptomyces sp. Ru72 TaxID=2080747 RepID=UPI000CDD2704|nr:endolytic transglycosylase MltG [Streptomyces sp. Ru72]POX47293.1 endolytic transglycosylase MltG [Streptomyces sp. Ru72]